MAEAVSLASPQGEGAWGTEGASGLLREERGTGARNHLPH